MNIAKVFFSLLTNDATFAGLVSTKVYPDFAPQTVTLPYCVVSVIGVDPSDTKDGVSKLDIIGVQLDIYANNYDTGLSIADAARAALDRYSGTNNGQVIDSIRFDGQTSGQFNYELKTFWCSQDYNVRMKL